MREKFLDKLIFRTINRLGANNKTLQIVLTINGHASTFGPSALAEYIIARNGDSTVTIGFLSQDSERTKISGFAA